MTRTEWRTSPLPRDWADRRKAVLDRDGGRCTWAIGMHDGGALLETPREGGPAPSAYVTPDKYPTYTEVSPLVGPVPPGLQAPTRCTSPATDVDHVGMAGDHRLFRLRSLCREHHAFRTAVMARARQRPTNMRNEEHPGFLDGGGAHWR